MYRMALSSLITYRMYGGHKRSTTLIRTSGPARSDALKWTHVITIACVTCRLPFLLANRGVATMADNHINTLRQRLWAHGTVPPGFWCTRKRLFLPLQRTNRGKLTHTIQPARHESWTRNSCMHETTCFLASNHTLGMPYA